MSIKSSTLPKYDPELVERPALEEVIELLPVRLTVSELCQRITADPQDERAVEAVRQAISDLRSWGLFRYRNDDQIVEPTQAAMQSFRLLTR
jgi:hypothetical protein